MSAPPFPPLDEATVGPLPWNLFATWLNDAAASGIVDANAMVIATADERGFPSARVVLLRGHDERGFIFFTNYDSRKGREIAQNPHVALVFLWTSFQRQIRIEGSIAKVSVEESDAYFHSRPWGHQLGSSLSPQSQVIASRDVLERRMIELTEQYQGKEVPRPPHWGGYRVTPSSIEFWQGRPNRLHDRLVYRRAADSWVIERLAP